MCCARIGNSLPAATPRCCRHASAKVPDKNSATTLVLLNALLSQVEARLARREEARAREDSPDLVPVTGGGDLMGGDDSFQAAKAR